jgi:hypothetical protein
MKNSNLINSVSSTSAPSTFYVFLDLEMNEMGGFSQTNRGKPLPDITNLLIAIIYKL